MKESILVLDYGSQYNQLIVRRIRELGVYATLVNNSITAKEISKMNVRGIILSGGPNSVYEEQAMDIDEGIFDLDIPILGICYGMQLISHKLGGSITASNLKEFGKTTIDNYGGIILQNTPPKQLVWMSHSDSVTEIPKDFTCCASSKTTQYVVVENPQKKIFGLQFHPEVTHSEYGMQMLKNFVDFCQINDSWTMDEFKEIEIKTIRESVKNEKVLLGLSGGVDSSVVAYLLNEAIGKQLYCVFVDTGLMRYQEAQEVNQAFKDLDLNFIHVDASEKFYEALKGISDPEEKRKIIGKVFIDVFNDEAQKLQGIKFLAQGTLYTDIIESGTNTSKTIKSHHNVGGLPADLEFTLIEPLNKLFKDEVRALGKSLNIPSSLVNRQPFPGPGLGIRVIGEVDKRKVELLQKADYILREEISNFYTNHEVWQYFAVLPGVSTVGVMGDNRTYDELCAIRCVSSIDGMTADFSRIDYDLLSKISTRIINEVQGINRVVYDITSKPPGTIEWE